MKNRLESHIPIVFAFDENFALPAWVALKSLLDAKHEETIYDIFVFHKQLPAALQKHFEQLAPIHWVHIDTSAFQNAPQSLYWPEIVYYRLLIHELLPQYDKVLWSDVDVFFKDDLSELYHTELGDAEAGAVAMEANALDVHWMHTKFPKNQKTFVAGTGLLLLNTARLREKNMTQRFLSTVQTFGPQIKMPDLDVFNLACEKIVPLPFRYILLEDLFNDFSDGLKSYPWLLTYYRLDELRKAVKDPAIIHYASKHGKIWNRRGRDIPDYYMAYMEVSPFFDRGKTFPSLFRRILRGTALGIIGVCPIKRIRKKYRLKLKNAL